MLLFFRTKQNLIMSETATEVTRKRFGTLHHTFTANYHEKCTCLRKPLCQNFKKLWTETSAQGAFRFIMGPKDSKDTAGKKFDRQLKRNMDTVEKAGLLMSSYRCQCELK